MAKPSRAKVKKLQSEAMKAAAERRAEKNQSKTEVSRGEAIPDIYAEVDHEWREIGLDTQARHALIDEGIYTTADLRKVSLHALKELDGVSPNAIRILIAQMKKKDIVFRSN